MMNFSGTSSFARLMLICKVFLMGALFLNSGYAAQGDAADQALQQLRLLQQRPAANVQKNADGTVNSAQTNAAQTGALAAVAGAGAAKPVAAAPVSPATATAALNAINNSPTVTVQPQDALQNSDEEDEEIDERAFRNLGRQLFPLDPAKIIQLKQKYHTTEAAQASTPGTPPKPTATSQFVNLSPGSTPPVIRLAQGFVSSLVFLDSTGAPWPITAYDLGDPASFNIQWDKTGNTLMIQAMKLYNYGNLAIRLKGLNTPVMLTLIPGQKAVDYRVDLRIQGYGPFASQLPMEQGIPPAANDILLHILDGVPPDNSIRLTVSGGDARAWLWREKMYVRTSLTILSPGWLASMTSADGTHAYEMQKAPVLLVSWHGKVMQLKVEGL